MPKRTDTPEETIGTCEGCGMVDHHLIESMCGRCRLLFGLPEKPPAPKANGKVRRATALDHRSFRERLAFVVCHRPRLH